MRLTLALLFVRPEDDLAEIVAALLRRLRILGVKVRRLYLDKGFCSIPITALPRSNRLARPDGLSHPGQKGWHPGAVSGSSQLSDPTHLQKARLTAVIPPRWPSPRTYATHKRRKRKKSGLRWLVFVIVNAKIQPQQARKWYRTTVRD